MSFPARLLPTPSWARLAVVPVLAFLALMTDRQYLLDFWHHLARGRWVVEHGELLNRDVFTYTVAGEPLQDVNWLTQVGYYLLYQQGGLPLVRTANALLVALTFLLVVLVCRQRSGSLPLAALAGGLAFFGSWNLLTLRPQTLSCLFFVLCYWSLLNGRGRPWLLLVPPLLTALWANTHGAFPAGVMLAGCFLLAAAWRAWRAGKLWADRDCWALAACCAATALATLANPYGWSVYGYVGVTSARAQLRGLGEWAPPGFDLMIGWFWAGSVLVVLGLYAVAYRRGVRPTPEDVVLLLVFGLLAGRSVRMVVWWLFVAAPVAAYLMARLTAKPQAAATEKPSLAAALMVAALTAAVVMALPGFARHNPLLAASGRPQAHTEDELDAVYRRVRALAPAGRVFTRFEWGEYLGWVGAPHHRVFMDGRIEIFPDAVWRDYQVITTGSDGWQQRLDGYGVDFLVLDGDYHAANGLLGAVERSPAWRQEHQVGGDILLYVRAERPSAAALLREEGP